jgi:arabinogalactan oligomer/maltooligosaccharide transport system substrate-binding protein
MKLSKLITAITAALAISYTAHATETLLVWEDINKGHGIEQAIADFEKANNVKVTMEQSDYVQHLAQYQERVDNGGAIPDVLMLPGDRLGGAAKNEQIIPLDFMESDRGKYLSNSVDAFTYNGKIYGCPRSVETMILFYNQDLLKYPFERFDDYYQFSKDLKAQGKVGLIGKWDTFYFIYGFLKGSGGYLFGQNADGSLNPKDLGVATPGSVQGMEYLSKVVRDILPSSILGDGGFTEIEKMFCDGKAAAVITGPWEFEIFAKSGINYGVSMLPKLPNGKDMEPFLGFRGYAITSKSPKKALATKFLQFINQPKYALQRYQGIQELPPIKEVLELPVIINDDFANAIAQQALHAEIMPSIPEMGSVWDPMNAATADAVTLKKEPAAALNEALEKIAAAIVGAPAPKAEEPKEEVKEEPVAEVKEEAPAPEETTVETDAQENATETATEAPAEEQKAEESKAEESNAQDTTTQASNEISLDSLSFN